MNLHEAMLQDVQDVFLNLEEFASVHEIEGREIACVIDVDDGMAKTGIADGFANASGLGILHSSQTVLCAAKDLLPQPLPGQKISVDGKSWIVGDNVSIKEGLLTLPMTRNF